VAKDAPVETDLFRADATPRIRVGIGGWTFAPWRDNFYPAKLPQRRELEFASRQVSAIEVNGTFYGAQKPASYAKWRRETPDGFVFSLKAPRYTTERKVLADAGKTIDDFIFGGLAELGNRLGPILWQLPPYHPFEPSDLAAFFELLPRSLDGYALRHVLEVRHASFMCDRYIDLARKQQIATVFTDSDKYPSFADITGEFVYARLMRSRADILNGYADTELKHWARRARQWADGHVPEDLPQVQTGVVKKAEIVKPRDVYIYFISSAKERNPAAAMALLRRFAE
jgi:uncharacterized protein YecE (DUF72 family)